MRDGSRGFLLVVWVGGSRGHGAVSCVFLDTLAGSSTSGSHGFEAEDESVARHELWLGVYSNEI